MYAPSRVRDYATLLPSTCHLRAEWGNGEFLHLFCAYLYPVQYSHLKISIFQCMWFGLSFFSPQSQEESVVIVP